MIPDHRSPWQNNNNEKVWNIGRITKCWKNNQNVTQRHGVGKCFWRNDANRLAWRRVATDLLFVKNAVYLWSTAEPSVVKGGMPIFHFTSWYLHCLELDLNSSSLVTSSIYKERKSLSRPGSNLSDILLLVESLQSNVCVVQVSHHNCFMPLASIVN